MQKSLMSVLVIGFALFFIYEAPTDASVTAGSFAEFSVEFLRRFGQFLTGLLDGAAGASQS